MSAMAVIKPHRCWWLALLLACMSWAIVVQAADPAAGPVAALQAKYKQLRPQLANNQFQRALHLDSTESDHKLKGDIHAVVDYPYANVSNALKSPGQWCDVLILHLNIKYCRAVVGNRGPMLNVRLGKKEEQELEDAYLVEFNFHPLAMSPEYFGITLTAADGPLGTHDYRILLEAIPIPGGRTFLHLTYSYSYGLNGRMAMQAYLATKGSNKVGFTVTGKKANGEPQYIKGVRGVVERNTMRYYLAIDAYLAALNTPPAEQLGKRLQGWFNAIEQYPRQLHELERKQYLEMKREEYKRQQSES